MSWLFDPPFGFTGVIALGAILSALLVLQLFRERRKAGIPRQIIPMILRLAAIGCIAVIALNPTEFRMQTTSGKPMLSALIDVSESMAVADEQGMSRLSTALAVLRDTDTLRKLTDAFELDIRVFDKTPRAFDLTSLTDTDARGASSDLGRALNSALATVDQAEAKAGVLLISDGRATAEGAEDAAYLALARSIPVWSWCLGGEVVRKDVWIEATASEVLAFSKASVELSATVRQTGFQNRSFNVQLVKDEQVIARRSVIPETDGGARVRFTVTAPETGEHRYVFRIEPEAEDADRSNDERSAFLRVVGEKVRVLLAEGQPHWESKFIVQTLKRSQHVDLTAVYRLGKGRFFAVLSSKGQQRREEEDLFPRTQGDMDAYDVVILGRGCDAFFDENTKHHLTSFVSDRGGGLVFARGKAYSSRFPPLAKLEPVVWDRGFERNVQFRSTSSGRQSPLLGFIHGDSFSKSEDETVASDINELLGRLPALDGVRRTHGEKPLAVSVLAGAATPGTDVGTSPILMAHQRYGQGRVLTVNAEGVWRWAFRQQDESEQDDELYGRFWLGLLRWLLGGSDFLPGANVALKSERRVYTDDQPMRFIISTKGIDPAIYKPVLDIDGAGAPVRIEPRALKGGAYEAEAGPFAPGDYGIRLHNNVGHPETLQLDIQVISGSIENRNLSANRELMSRIAAVSGGGMLTAADIGNLDEVVRQWQRQQQLASDKNVLWDRWWLLLALVAILALGWYLRRRAGLL